MKKSLLYFLLVALLAIGTTSLVFAGTAKATKVTMLFWPGPESEAMQKVVDKYNETKGIKDGINVELLTFSRQGFFDKQEVALAEKAKILIWLFPLHI